MIYSVYGLGWALLLYSTFLINLAAHPEYAEYRRRVPMLLPLRRKSNPAISAVRNRA